MTAMAQCCCCCCLDTKEAAQSGAGGDEEELLENWIKELEQGIKGMTDVVGTEDGGDMVGPSYW